MPQITALKTNLLNADARLPAPSAWDTATPISFCTDWRGDHADPQRETRARFLWSNECLFVQFLCRYRQIHVYEGGNARRDQLWLRDVAELFIRPGTDDPLHYREFEISPNGDWLDLDIDHGQKSILYCNLESRVRIDAETSIWSAELAIPFSCLTASLNPEEVWRLNIFRIEGPEPGRFYSAWSPTFTSKPNFHVPEYFGELHFANP
jgi:alpha-galactosidase